MAKLVPEEGASVANLERVEKEVERIFDEPITAELFCLMDAFQLRSEDLNSQIVNVEIGGIVEALFKLDADDLLLFLDKKMGFMIVSEIISGMFPGADTHLAVTAFVWRIYGEVYSRIGAEVAKSGWYSKGHMHESLAAAVMKRRENDDVEAREGNDGVAVGIQEQMRADFAAAGERLVDVDGKIGSVSALDATTPLIIKP